MIKLNNKGQSLVMFILIIPVLVLIMILVIDIGNGILEKQRIDNINYLIVNYALDNIDDINLENKLINLITLNDKELSVINVKIENDIVNIELKKNIKGIFNKKLKLVSVTSKYIGYIDDNKKIIERG